MLSYYVPPERLIDMMRRADKYGYRYADDTFSPFGIPRDIWENWKKGVWLDNPREVNLNHYMRLVSEWEKITKNGKLGL